MSGPPPPPPLSLGAVPAVRLKSEINESRPEPPACVQNAMMTKDKKPFTYTPGGLDLSQIRSPRMAKRVSRNAQAEGVTGVPQSPMSPGGPGPGPIGGMGGSVGPGGPMGGMPPPPPPPPGMGGPMPPPPPPSGIPSAPKPPSNNNNLPPYSRPDIKIPENPMQLLRKTGGPVVRQAPLIGPDEEITKQPIIGPGGQPMAPPPAPVPVQQQPTVTQQPMQAPQQQQQASPPVRAPVQSPPVQQQGQQPMYRPVRPPQQVFQQQQSPQPQPQMYQPPPPQQQMYQPPPPPQAQVYQQPQQQMQQQPQQQQPRFESRQQIGSLYIPPLSPEELQQKSPPTRSGPESPGSPMDTLKKAPTPWLHARGQQRQQEVPAWARSPPDSAGNTAPSTPATPQTPGAAAATRVVPVKIEKEADLIDNQQQQMQQQQMQQWQQQQQQAFLQQQQQWRQQQLQQQQQQQLQQQQQQQLQQQQQKLQQQQQQFRQVHQQSQQSTQQSQQHVVRVIPIQIEGRTNSGPMSPNNNVSTPDLMDGPVQSPTFRVLQRVTSRDEEIHAQPAVPHPATASQPFTPPPTDQVRRLQLADDDQKFMNRVRNQVDEEKFLHSEEDPRYRGAAIPSKAFRMLQSMTDAAEASGDPNCVPRAVLVNRGPPGVKKNQPGTPTGEQNQNNLPPSEQRAPEPRKYTGSAIPSRSFQMLQAMVAPENCANGSDESYPYDPNYYPYYDPMYPYWDPYWSYYDPNYTPDPNATAETAQNSTTVTDEEYYQPQQLPYWDPYYYYYYGYYPPPPHTYSPHAFYPSNETDDYSSTDEMCYYGARFPKQPCSHKSNEEKTPTDTEVEEINEEDPNRDSKTPGLHSIRSVSDIQVYNDNNSTTDDQSSINEEDSESDTDSENTEDCEENEDNEAHLPHQLSIIFEENEISECDRKKRESSVATTISEEDSSTTIGGNHEETEESEESCDEDLGETSVTVRLPLKLKFGVSKNGTEEVTELIVGDSEMEPNTPENSIKSPLLPLQRQNSDETIDHYETADENDEQSRDNSPVEEETDTDFWEEINKNVKSDNEGDKIEEDNDADGENEQQEEEDDDDSSSSSDDEESNYNLEEDLRSAFSSQAIKEQFRKLREAGKLSLGTDAKEESISVRQRIMAFENNVCPSASRSSSAKGCDLSEDDSGVTSDVSRQDTDTECNEKMKRRYERAATHSRLFKLLQDECAKSDDEDDNEEDCGDNREERKKQLCLTLNSSEPESGICSPSSPNWLARELVNGLLGGQYGRKYKSLPIEKLYATVCKILQEENNTDDESYASYYSSFKVAKCPRVPNTVEESGCS